MDRSSLIEKLVTTGHLNVPERRELGRITRDEVKVAVREILERDGGFPPAARADAGAVYEGPQIRRSEQGGYLAIVRRCPPLAPNVVAESSEQSFPDAESVVDWYVQAEWGAEIDGIPLS